MTEKKEYYCYLLASNPYGTLYIGVTSNLVQRIYQHKSKLIEGFTKKYNISQLVWYEIHSEIETVIYREKQIKKWNRKWKIELMQNSNPEWTDLYPGLL